MLLKASKTLVFARYLSLVNQNQFLSIGKSLFTFLLISMRWVCPNTSNCLLSLIARYIYGGKNKALAQRTVYEYRTVKRLFFSDGDSGLLGKNPSAPLRESSLRPSDYRSSPNIPDQYRRRKLIINCFISFSTRVYIQGLPQCIVLYKIIRIVRPLSLVNSCV